jgi:hypothetical protein
MLKKLEEKHGICRGYLDLNKEERAKSKTVEVERGFFETERRRYTILDVPGHKTFVPNMIGGASQADVGILVISARKGEYETGFEKGGQTREHAMLAKTQGVNKLVVGCIAALRSPARTGKGNVPSTWPKSSSSSSSSSSSPSSDKRLLSLYVLGVM